MAKRNFISVGQFPVPPSDVYQPADINNVYSKNAVKIEELIVELFMVVSKNMGLLEPFDKGLFYYFGYGNNPEKPLYESSLNYNNIKNSINELDVFFRTNIMSKMNSYDILVVLYSINFLNETNNVLGNYYHDKHVINVINKLNDTIDSIKIIFNS